MTLFVKMPTSRHMSYVRVECVVCGRQGPGYEGSASWIKYAYTWAAIPGWMRACLIADIWGHIWECACGRFFATSQSLGSHVAQNMRHHIEGHGKMHEVGYRGIAWQNSTERGGPSEGQPA